MDIQTIETARSILGTLHLECSMAGIALRGVRKHGPDAFAQTIQRMTALMHRLEEISEHNGAAEQQLHLGINEAIQPRSRDGSNGEYLQAGG